MSSDDLRPERQPPDMDNPEEIWNLLHDGGIAGVHGVVPGDVTLRIEIDYLTRTMTPPCDAIDLILLGCESFEYLHWSDDRRTTDVGVLSEIEPEILSATRIDTGVRVICSGGQFDLLYKDLCVVRADGTPTSVGEIKAAATAYWDAFDRR
jgi:hypothetical protein